MQSSIHLRLITKSREYGAIHEQVDKPMNHIQSNIFFSENIILKLMTVVRCRSTVTWVSATRWTRCRCRRWNSPSRRGRPIRIRRSSAPSTVDAAWVTTRRMMLINAGPVYTSGPSLSPITLFSPPCFASSFSFSRSVVSGNEFHKSMDGILKRWSSIWNSFPVVDGLMKSNQ